jgi:hypothetical protein
VRPVAAPRVLLDFDEVRRRLRLGTRVDVGQQEIPVERVIGSAGRSHEFDGSFRPRTHRLRRVMDQIQANIPEAADMPITVNQVDEAYFVVDGHKRMSMAVAEGRAYIDAVVTRYQSRFHVDRATTMDAVRSTQEELAFREKTGLAAGVPEARFPVADPDDYLDLEESVKAHAYDLSVQRGEHVPPPVAARHWYEVVFKPVLAAVSEAGYDRLLSTCSDAERFLIMRHGNRATFGPNWELPQAGVDRGLENLRAAAPSRIATAAARLAGRRPREARLLPEGSDRRQPDA